MLISFDLELRKVIFHFATDTEAADSEDRLMCKLNSRVTSKFDFDSWFKVSKNFDVDRNTACALEVELIRNSYFFHGISRIIQLVFQQDVDIKIKVSDPEGVMPFVMSELSDLICKHASDAIQFKLMIDTKNMYSADRRAYSEFETTLLHHLQSAPMENRAQVMQFLTVSDEEFHKALSEKIRNEVPDEVMQAALLEKFRKDQSALKIQSLFRGYFVRKQVGELKGQIREAVASNEFSKVEPLIHKWRSIR